MTLLSVIPCEKPVTIGLALVLTSALPQLAASISEIVYSGGAENAYKAFTKSMMVVGVAEVFDKTWFVTLVLSLKIGKQIAFLGSFAALAVHTLLSAVLGLAIARYVRASTLDFATAALFTLFAIMYAKDYYYADPDGDMISAGKEEADECFGDTPAEPGTSAYGGCGESQDCQGVSKCDEEQPKTLLQAVPQTKASPFWRKLFQAFLMVFVAEWGDRTQFAMIGLHSSLPVVPVFLGSLVAFFILCLSAVMVAAVVEKQPLSERLIYGCVSLSFVVFALLSLRDGMIARADGM